MKKTKKKTLQIDKDTVRNLDKKIFQLDALFWAIKNLDWQQLDSESEKDNGFFCLTMLGELGGEISNSCLREAEKLYGIQGEGGDTK